MNKPVFLTLLLHWDILKIYIYPYNIHFRKLFHTMELNITSQLAHYNIRWCKHYCTWSHFSTTVQKPLRWKGVHCYTSNRILIPSTARQNLFWINSICVRIHSISHASYQRESPYWGKIQIWLEVHVRDQEEEAEELLRQILSETRRTGRQRTGWIRQIHIFIQQFFHKITTAQQIQLITLTIKSHESFYK